MKTKIVWQKWLKLQAADSQSLCTWSNKEIDAVSSGSCILRGG